MCAQLGITPVNYPTIGATSPGFPFPYDNANADETLPRFRCTEEQDNGAQETWKLFGNGSVGRQALSGIPYLHKLRYHQQLDEYSIVWPFETGFADPTRGNEGPQIVHAEIFPKAVGILNDAPNNGVPDEQQVWSMVQHARNLDAADGLLPHFLQPAVLNAPALDDVLTEEGWILFVH